MKTEFDKQKYDALTNMYEDALETMSRDEIMNLLREVNYLRNQLKNQNKTLVKLKQQALHDPLTSLPNRRYFEEELDKSLAHHTRYGRMGALVMIDANDFKTINDTLGHLAGDAVLCHIAEVLRRNLRTSDVVARVGGDEFCIILHEVTPAEALKKAKTLVEDIASSPCRYEGRDVHISVSAGVCSYADARTKAELFAKADEAMYTDKAAGVAVAS